MPNCYKIFEQVVALGSYGVGNAVAGLEICPMHHRKLMLIL